MALVIREEVDWIAVAKPEGLDTIPAEGRSGCLLSLVSELRKERLYVVHRLDREVSGVILFARNPAAHRRLNGEFEERRIHKTYLAVVAGSPSAEEGTIDAPLREFGSGRVGVDPERGKPCVTRWRVRERAPGATLLEVRPETGRRHQIRAHLYHIGHPILGDARYGDAATAAACRRLMLHALSVEFVTRDGLTPGARAEPPPSFADEWRRLLAGGQPSA